MGRSVGRSVCATPARQKPHGPLNASRLWHERVGAAELPKYGRSLHVPTEIVSHAAGRPGGNRSRPSLQLVRAVALGCVCAASVPSEVYVWHRVFCHGQEFRTALNTKCLMSRRGRFFDFVAKVESQGSWFVSTCLFLIVRLRRELPQSAPVL